MNRNNDVQDQNLASIGRPRLDPTTRLQHRFYEPLLLLWMLNPARGPSSLVSNNNPAYHDFLTTWRGYLDALSWLCDFDHGGRTVSSVAGETLPAGTRYWLACKHGTALPHLCWILSLLRDSGHAITHDAAIIAERSIELSKDKIKNYKRELSRAIDWSLQNAEENGTQGQSKVSLSKRQAFVNEVCPGVVANTVVVALRNLRDPGLQALDLCRAALLLEPIGALNDLIVGQINNTGPNDWARVYHYIIRLRSWHQKATTVVRFARRYPALLQDHSCEWLKLPADRPMPAVDGKTTLLSALGRMLPKEKQSQAADLHRSMRGLRDFDFETCFVDSYGKDGLSLAVHAEVFLLEHFYLNDLRFVERDRYVGCSKPSCYCCSLYIRYHPGNFVLRASHGTAWVTWSPPLLCREGEAVALKHNLYVMNRVIEHLRRDVLSEIENRFPRRQRRPDSTSGIPSRLDFS